MESQHTPHKSHTIQIVKNHHYNLHLGLLRMLREARKNTPPPMQKQGVWPGCGQGASKWVGLTYKVNSVWFYLYLHLQQQPWIRSKNMIKALEPGFKSPENPTRWHYNTFTTSLHLVPFFILCTLQQLSWKVGGRKSEDTECGKLLREKIFANWWKIQFCGENVRGLLTCAAPKNTSPPSFAKKFPWIGIKLRNSWKFSPSKVFHNTVDNLPLYATSQSCALRYFPASCCSWKHLIMTDMAHRDLWLL